MQTELVAAAPFAKEPNKKINFNLESLRGFAAILVVWHHIILHKYWLDPSYTPSGVFAFVAPGHLSVLVFFVLSGYVIGYAHSNPLEGKDIALYLKKRFVRIYPIYLVSMLFAFLVAKQPYSLATILGNLALTQNLLTSVVFENNPAWSLNYEVLFYLLFLPLSIFRWNVVAMTALMLLVAVVAYFQGFGLVASYALGFAFWLCGLVLAKYFQHSIRPSFGLMVSMLFLLLSLEPLNTLTTILSKFTIIFLKDNRAFVNEPLRYLDISYLPYCMVIVLVFASKEFAYRKFIILAAMLLPIPTFYHVLRTPALHQSLLVLPFLFYGLSLIFYVFHKVLDNWCSSFIHWLSATGAISYGLYIIHFPIIAIFSRVTFFSGTGLTFGLRLIIYLICCAIASYLLEKRFQPWVRNLIG